ncbi:Transcriptional regulatory protein OmpR [Marinomonas spartinae]|uniref:SpoIIE family protein phosphatase n=1 Tax=Marinomonas spartinae TaxID=1792290 RepID=UPI0008090699|nr:SpoIIE family protein phosphatase [Marinomonas spartinae]SBS39393.1 Transcriptional regulatory protein OmpR [Marinomonas spartinae]
MNNRKKVLLVEDSFPTQSLIKNILSSHDLEVIAVASNKKAKQLVDEYDFHLIILDVNLEDGPSQSFMEYIHNKNNRLPVVVLTADLENRIISDFYELGAKDFLHKPINVYLFSRKIISAVESYSVELEELRKTVLLERIMHDKDQEEALAFYVYDHIIKQNIQELVGIEHASLSHGKFCGDILMQVVKPNGNLMIILADATGHGMAAALTIYPMVTTFTALVNKGFSTAAILLELNKKHAQTVPHNRFISCIMIEILYQENEISIWNAGMPDVLLMDKSHQPLTRVKSKNMALGILSNDTVKTKFDRFSLDEVGFAMLMSDGVIENKISDGKLLSFQEIYQDLESSRMHPLDIINKYHALSESIDDVDDMSFSYVDFCKVKESLSNLVQQDDSIKDIGNIELCSTFQGKSLANEEIVSSFITMLETYSFSADFLQKVFLVLTELVSNAIDHGVLSLSSGLKEKDFCVYLDQRSEGLRNVLDDEFIEITIKWVSKDMRMMVDVKDSGSGYDLSALDSDDTDGLHGRGIKLIRKISESFYYDKTENKTTVLIA